MPSAPTSPARRRTVLVAGLLACAILAGIAIAILTTGSAQPDRLYGNVEIRQVDLAFNAEGTVATMLKQEGDPVQPGEAIATLDPATYTDAEGIASARRDAAQAALDKLLNGTRPEDILQARAAVANAKATLADAVTTFQRQKSLLASHTISQQSYDDAERAQDVAAAQLALNDAALSEMFNGPRIEDIDAARAQLRQAQASLSLSQTQLARTVLHAPCTGIVMTRVIEPGTVVLPTTIVYSVAITDQVWVRAFVPEPMLARVAPGTKVQVFTDGRPDRP